MIKRLYLDFDGTISDAKHIAYESLIKTLDEFGYNYKKSEAKKHLGWKMARIFDEMNLPKKDLKRFRKRFYKLFTDAALHGGIKLCVSVKPLLELSKKYKLVVVSNSETKFLRACIKKLRIEGLFSEVYGSEKFKEKNEMLKKLFKKAKIKPSEAIYLGDRFSDVIYAKKAGCISVSIYNKCSWSTLSEIEAEKPDYIISDFYGLDKLVTRLNK